MHSQKRPRAGVGGDTDTTDKIELPPIADRLLRSKRKTRRASFIVHGGLDIGQVIPLEDAVTVIGRGSKCSLTLVDDAVSRYHAEVIRKGPESFLIRDLDSTNGTFVEGERIITHELADGDRVLFGQRIVLKFALQDEFDEDHSQDMYEAKTRDSLTGSFNQRYITKRLVGDISFACRQKMPFTLIMFDIDHFRAINESQGAQTGDLILKSVARIVGNTIRTEDALGRYGGEEFAVVAQGTDFKGGQMLGERIREAVCSQKLPFQNPPDRRIGVTVSVGVVTVPTGAPVDVTSVIAEADSNLFTAKDNGRDQVVSSLITSSRETI